MKRDALAVLLRVRNAAVTEAGRDLAAARLRARQAAESLQAQALRIRQEQASTLAGDVAAFAAWLPHARSQSADLKASLDIEEERVQRYQQILVRRKTDAEAVAKAIERRGAEALVIRSRKDQNAMDEAAGRASKRD